MTSFEVCRAPPIATFRGFGKRDKERAVNQPISMTAFSARRDRKDQQTMGAPADANPARNVDYALIIVGIVYVVFAVLGYFAAGEITGF
jgi:hypothetical protein